MTDKERKPIFRTKDDLSLALDKDDLMGWAANLPANAQEAMERIQLWVNALFSEEYTQGTNYLRKRGRDSLPDLYCCLGIACEVTIKNGLDLTPANHEVSRGGMRPSVPVYRYGAGGDYQLLPKEAMNWFGFPLMDRDNGSDLLLKIDLHRKYHYVTRPLIEHLMNTHGEGSFNATQLNDEYKFTFKQIGELIAIQYGLDYPRPETQTEPQGDKA